MSDCRLILAILLLPILLVKYSFRRDRGVYRNGDRMVRVSR